MDKNYVKFDTKKQKKTDEFKNVHVFKQFVFKQIGADE